MKNKLNILSWFLAMLFSIVVNAQNTKPVIPFKINGSVTEKLTNKPISGALVNIKGTNQTVLTDLEGKFSIQTNLKSPQTVIISLVGYETKEQLINSNFTVISLKEDFKELKEVIVNGYSSVSKKVFTGSISKIDAKNLENRPAQSFDQLLGGQVSGLNIIQPSGTLNNTPVIRIRGINSVTSSIYPLFIVDGVTVFTGTSGGSINNNPLADINPSDIESIDILKDASASAIYGSRASNGVVVVTTKKGKKGDVKVNYDNWFSWSKASNLPSLLNANDYVTIKNEARVNAGLSPGFALGQNADGSITQTDWYDVAYRTGESQNHNLSLSGATNKTNYFVSSTYSNQNGILKTNSFKKQGIRLNLEQKINDKISIGTNFNYSNSKNSGPSSGSTGPNSVVSSSGNSVNTQYIGLQPLGRLTYILPPNVSVYNTDGTYNINSTNGNIGYGSNSSSLGVFNAYNLQTILDLDKNTSENNTLIGSLYAEIELLKNLKFKTLYGKNNFIVENKEFRNILSGDGFTTKGTASNSNTKYSRSSLTNTLTYTASINNLHNLKVLLGQEKNTRTADGWGATRTGITDPYYTSYQGGYTTIIPSSNFQTENVLISYFSSIGYDYNKKYLLNLNFRRDGLSALAKGNKWGNFGGGSLGWNISEENFFQKSSLGKFINSLKIRTSYGIVGNSELNDFASLSQYSSGTYAGVSTLYFSQSGNEALQWETSKKFNIGFDIGLFNNRITIEADYYKNNITDLILNTPQALSQGIPNNSISSNVGSLYNKGIEFNINADILTITKLQWSANLNLSTIKNKVTNLGGVGDIYPTALSTFGIQNITREGYSVGSIFAVPTIGVNPTNGNRIYINKNNEEVQYNALNKSFTYLDGTTAPSIDNYRDGRIQGPSLPTYYGGLTNNISYQNFDLSIGINFSGGNKLYNGTRATTSDQRFFNNGTFIKDRWTTSGQITDVPKLVYGDSFSTGFSSSNSAYVEDGSYIKLKNILLGYRLPIKNSIINKFISSAKIYAQATNLYTITKYRGADPEISINGNSIYSGKDQNVPVNASVYTLGLNIGF